MKLHELEMVASAATPGPWFAADWSVNDGPDLTTIEAHEPEGQLPPGCSSIWPDGVCCINVASTKDGVNPLPDAAYIAACSPDVVLRLIAVARAATAHFGAVDDRARACDSGEWLALSIAALDTESALRSALAELDAQQEPT